MTDNYNDDIDIFDEGEFVFTQQTNANGEKEFIGGGYKLDTFFLENEISPMTTFNTNNTNNETILNGGKKVSSPFENLAVPAGLFYINQRVPKYKENIQNNEYEHYKQHVMASDDLIDKLYGLVEVDKKRKRKTHKKLYKLTKKHTRRHK
jgi:hypothetical protein